MGNRLVGIDFGHDVVRGVEVEEPGTRKSRVLRTGSVPFPPEAVVSGEVRDPQAVASALRQLWSKSGFKAKRVVLGMGNSRVLARDLTVGVRPLARIRESLRFQVADMLPMPLENAVLDYYPVRYGADDHGVPVYHGLLIATLKDVVLTNEKAARLAGLEVVGVDVIPFALVRALADRASNDTWAFVDVGATTTSISIATAGVPEFVRIVPSGGEDVTRSLMELGQLPREQAEQIKRSVGLISEGVDPKYRPVVELMVTRSSELMTSIRDTLAYFSDTRQRRVAHVLLTGGGARLGGFPQMVTAWTRIPATLDASSAESEFTVAAALTTGVSSAKERKAGQSMPAPAAPAADPAPADAPPPTGSPGGAPLSKAQAKAQAKARAKAQAAFAAAERGRAKANGAESKKASIWTRPIGGKR